MPTSDNNSDPQVDKNAPYRTSRRATQQSRARKNSPSSGRRIVVRSELREQPDVRKIARAIIAMAMADAQREAEAQAGLASDDSKETRDE